ncbi:MAG: CoA transferase, partial [Dehalococcoidia bacterium]
MPDTTPADTTTERLPLSGLRAIEVCDGIAGAFAGRWLALLGADVVKVEPPSGHPMRRAEPLFDGDRSVLFEILNAGKRSVTLDTDSAEGQERLRALLGRSDILVHDEAPTRAAFS